jgi:hypothetical protein
MSSSPAFGWKRSGRGFAAPLAIFDHFEQIVGPAGSVFWDQEPIYPSEDGHDKGSEQRFPEDT